jgi:opacity protein-like surface antigen
MGIGRTKSAKFFALCCTAGLVSHSAAVAADYPQMRGSVQPQYYPQPVYQQPAPVYQPQPVYQAPQPVYVPQPQPVYAPPPVYTPPPVMMQPPPPPPPVIAPPTPVVYQNSGYASAGYAVGGAGCGECGGWYLRGDVGITNQDVDHLDNALFAGANVTHISKGFDSGMLIGAGVGYQFNSGLRADVTGEYRGKTAFRGLDTYRPEPASGTGVGADDYTGSKSEWLYLANLYLDLGTWSCFTPFVGFGVGMAKVTIHDFRDVNVPTSGVAYGADASQWNLAWALHAGVGYEISQNLMLELSYRYVNLGDGQSGDLITYDGTNNVNNPMKFKDITSQDVRLGLRWKFNCCDVAPPPPPVVYQPPPPPQPLMRRG